MTQAIRHKALLGSGESSRPGARIAALAARAHLVLAQAPALSNEGLLEHLGDTSKSTEEAERSHGAQVLGHNPLEKCEKGEDRRLTLQGQPGGRAAEAYRVLRNSLESVSFEHHIKTLLVTAPAPAKGKSAVAANLAAVLAQGGAKVALVDCDFRRSTTTQFLDVNNLLGLSDVLAGRVSLHAALQEAGLEKLSVLAPGKLPPNPSELLGSQTMIDLVAALKADYDWIIVGSPPLLAVADAAASSRWTDGTLIVTRAGVSTHPAAVHARSILDQGVRGSSGGRVGL